MAYGSYSGNPYNFAVSSGIDISLSQIIIQDPLTSYSIYNNLSDNIILTPNNGSWTIHSQGDVAYIRCYLLVGGLGPAYGLWFSHQYNRPLPDGVNFCGSPHKFDSLVAGYYDAGDRYFSGATTLNYEVTSTEDITFDLDPNVRPYGNSFSFGTGGLVSRFSIEAYGRANNEHTWKRIS